MLLLHPSHNDHSRYSHFLAEILRLEGFVDFEEVDFGAVEAATLDRHDLVILPRLALTRAQAELLATYVTGGGRLVAFLPDDHFARRFGLAPTWRAIDNGWLQLDSAQPALRGLCAEPVQVIVPTAGWSAAENASTTVLAQIRAGKAATAAGQPGLVWSKVGAGEAMLFAYDLPHAVARLRQGNPEHADLCYAGLDGIYRPSELFVGQLDADQMLLPQADIHTALLARCIETLAPRPRLWYYPEAHQRSVMIMTSDDDWSTVEQFDALLSGLRQYQATCTFYVVPETKLNRSLIDAWEAEGHTFSVHPALETDIRSYLAKDEPQRALVAEMVRTNVARHRHEHGRPVHTIRHHAVRWLGYVEAAHLLAALGVQMELNYVSVHPFSLGYMAGSGRPLRFVDTDGTVIDCYQQPTLWTEEVLIHPRFVFSFKWSVERALAEVGKIIGRAVHEFYTPITFNSHPVSFATYSSPLIEGTWEQALAAGMPILSADRWLAWTAGRDQVRIELEAGGCTVCSPLALAALTLLFPEKMTPQAAEATSGQQTLWGQPYAVITLKNLAAGERRRLTWN